MLASDFTNAPIHGSGWYSMCIKGVIWNPSLVQRRLDPKFIQMNGNLSFDFNKLLIKSRAYLKISCYFGLEPQKY